VSLLLLLISLRSTAQHSKGRLARHNERNTAKKFACTHEWPRCARALLLMLLQTSDSTAQKRYLQQHSQA
jgi:hypothetical protein